jgi:hypothetical protein
MEDAIVAYSDVSDKDAFSAYAGNDLATWRMLVGQRVTHTRFGQGTIVATQQSQTDNLIFSVRFDKDTQDTRISTFR